MVSGRLPDIQLGPNPVFGSGMTLIWIVEGIMVRRPGGGLCPAEAASLDAKQAKTPEDSAGIITFVR